MWISTMTIVELASAVGLIIAGLAGLIKASNCKEVKCSLTGIECKKDILPPVDDVTTELEIPERKPRTLKKSRNLEALDLNS